jgi:hypothetical protein
VSLFRRVQSSLPTSCGHKCLFLTCKFALVHWFMVEAELKCLQAAEPREILGSLHGEAEPHRTGGRRSRKATDRAKGWPNRAGRQSKGRPYRSRFLEERSVLVARVLDHWSEQHPTKLLRG